MRCVTLRWLGLLLVAALFLVACQQPKAPAEATATAAQPTPATAPSPTVPATTATPQPMATPTAAAEKKEVIIGYAAPGLVGGQRDILNGFLKHATEKGWRVVVTNSGGDPQKQINQIEDFIAQGVDAIVAVPDDSRAICAAVEAAKRAKIPFYTIDRAPIGCEVNMTVLSDNYLAGQQAGEAVIEYLKKKYGSPKGKVLEITGNLGQNVAQLRGGGFQDVIKKYPDVQLITKAGDWDADKGQAIVRDVVSANPDLDAIYMHSDAVYMPGTLAVLEQLGRKFKRDEPNHIFLASVDCNPVGVQAIREGWADMCSSQPIPDFGIIVNFIEKELNGEAITEGTVTQPDALWSPATIEKTDVGFQLLLRTTPVTIDNVNDPRLWANQVQQ